MVYEKMLETNKDVDNSLTIDSKQKNGLKVDSDTEVDGEGYLEEEGEGGDSGGDDETTNRERPTSSPAKKKKRKKKKFMGICLANCKYDSVRRMARKFGMKEVGEDDDWTLYWTDYSVALERVMEMKKYQKINHFPGMSEICRKDLLARNLTRLQKLFPKEFAIFPRTWVLPADYGDFLAFCRTKKNKTYICKPESGCQGKGIFITKNIKDIKPGEHQVCQQYVSKPFLIDGFKFDLRIYVLVTSCDPLRIYVYKDGLARFATIKYIEPTSNNTDEQCMHLTNYAINKHSSDFIRDDDCGSKRKITTVDRWFEKNGYDIKKIWADMEDVIIKTLISAHPILKHNYRTCFPNHVKGSGCFEILGFDLMLDRKLKPWVLEVNHSPSFHTDAKLDKEVKEGFLYDALCIMNLSPFDRKKCIEEEKKKIKERLMNRSKPKESRREEMEECQASANEAQMKYEAEHSGDFRRIYPIEGHKKYEQFFQHSGSLFQQTAASKARGECARQQREEIRAKQEKLECMLKKNRPASKEKEMLRPESPGSEKTKRRTLMRCSVPRVARRPYRLPMDDAKVDYHQPIDSMRPLDISEDDELDRVSALLQRDNLVRGLGVVEHVYRLLHCTPGTVGVLKSADRAVNVRNFLGARRLYSSLTYCNRHNKYLHLEPPPSQKKSEQEQKLGHKKNSQKNDQLDFEITNSSTRPGVRLNSGSSRLESHSDENTNSNATHQISKEPRLAWKQNSRHNAFSGINKSSQFRKVQREFLQNPDLSIENDQDLGPYTTPLLLLTNLNYPKVNCTSNNSTSSEKQAECHNLTNNPSEKLDSTAIKITMTSSKSQTLNGRCHPHPPVHSGQWRSAAPRSRLLSQTNSSHYLIQNPSTKTQRQRFDPRKVLPQNRDIWQSAVVPEQHKIKDGIQEDCVRVGGRANADADYLSNIGPVPLRRVLSASSSKRDLGHRTNHRLLTTSSSLNLPSNVVCSPPSNVCLSSTGYGFSNVVRVSQSPLQGGGALCLSLVSGPAPVVQRPDLRCSTHSAGSSQGVAIETNARSTKSQRIRGASNSLRLKQLELREHQAVVLS
ncbi:tubulin polyglutamylase TTLL13-like isoform X2 [Antedon mediterranea]|uniref:tubulin polyglutamylase TTLL13-like isoform X2 n=1 Tax=Antedon mediterranea TaxID=105859 RepID=UPI003AF44BF7